MLLLQYVGNQSNCLFQQLIAPQAIPLLSTLQLVQNYLPHIALAVFLLFRAATLPARATRASQPLNNTATKWDDEPPKC